MMDIKINSAEILCVGTEILIGDIINTNAAFISKKLAALGINQYYQGVVGDNPARLERRITEAMKRCDLLIMTGGLGPTYDDLTKETAANHFGREMRLDERSLERMTVYLHGRNRAVSEPNKKQAMMPEGAVIFDNNHGTAPGLAIEDEEKGKVIIMLPGPPRECVPMFEESVEPYLRKFSQHIFYSKNINITGIGESAVEGILSDYMKNHENPTVAPYCKEGEVRLRVTAKVKTPKEGEALCGAAITEITATEIGKYVYGIDTTLEEAAVSLLRERGARVATAESCTGGLISQKITSVPGSSEVFDGGFVTYSNGMKVKMLGVREETLREFGAVSRETAQEMAAGALNAAGADYGIAVTGIAGPGGGTAEKPVGLIYIALAWDDGFEVAEHKFWGEREYVRLLTSNAALHMMIKKLKNIQ